MSQFCTKILNKKLGTSQKSAGFTLAEVLITLGIIGIVAEITIPTLMQNVQDAQFYTATKKAYSTFTIATEKMVYDNGGTIFDVSSADSTTLSKAMTDAYAQYFSVVREDFIENIQTKDWRGYKSTSTFGLNNGSGTRYALLLKDGSVIRFNAMQNCNSPMGNIVRCGAVVVDVNGNNSPNMLGKDAFVFNVTKDANGNYKVVPSGPDTDGFTCTVGATTFQASYGCTEYVINNQPLPQ